MKEADAELVIQRAREAYPFARPRVITLSDVKRIVADFIAHYNSTRLPLFNRLHRPARPIERPPHNDLRRPGQKA